MFKVEILKTCKGNIYSFQNSVEVKISISIRFCNLVRKGVKNVQAFENTRDPLMYRSMASK